MSPLITEDVDLDLTLPATRSAATLEPSNSPSPRWAKAGALVVSLCVVVGATWTLARGHAADGLAEFRRWDMSKGGNVELVGEIQAVDDFVCFLDTYEAALRLMLTIVVFRNMANTCAPGTAELTVMSRNACQDNFFGGLREFLYMTVFIAQAISDCLGTLVVPASCAAGILGLLGGLTNFPAGVYHTMNSCEPWYKNEHVTPYGVSRATLRDSRRLAALPWPTLAPTAQPDSSEFSTFQTNIMVCVNIAQQYAHYLVRGVLILWGTTKTCAPANTETAHAKQICASSIFTILALASTYAHFTGVLIGVCPGWGAGDTSSKDGMCIQGVTSFTNCIFAVTSVSMQFEDLCPKWLLTSTLEPTPIPVNKWLTTSVAP